MFSAATVVRGAIVVVGCRRGLHAPTTVMRAVNRAMLMDA